MIGNAGLPQLLLILFVATPIVVSLYMTWLCSTRGGDPKLDSITVEYEPPNNLSPGECGTLLANVVAFREITATIADLSVRGYLTIEQKGHGESPSDHKDFILHLGKPTSDWDRLKPHEHIVLKSIFFPTNPLLMVAEGMSRLQEVSGAAEHAALASIYSRVAAKARDVSEAYRSLSGMEEGPRTSVPLSELANHFTLHLAEIREAIYAALVAGGYYGHRPDRVRQVYAAKGIFLGLVMAAIGAVLAAVTSAPPIALILFGLLTGALVLGFGWFLPARTSTGTRTLAKVLGFREFLGRVEKDHIERLEKTPELFEKYLPYAMALGVEARWTQAFGAINLPPPHWYKGGPGGGFLPLHLVNGLNQMSNQTGSMLTSSPGSSGDTGNISDSGSND